MELRVESRNAGARQDWIGFPIFIKFPVAD
jgi:hypothetical protein